MADPWADFSPQTQQTDEWAAFSPSKPQGYGDAFGNVGSDIVKTAKEMGSAAVTAGDAILSNPGRTVINAVKAVPGLVKGAAQGVADYGQHLVEGLITDPEKEHARLRAEADQRKQHFIERPVSTLANIALQGSPAGELTAGRGLLKAGTLGAKAADEVAGVPAAMVSGVSRRSQRAAFAAGEKGGAEGTAFREAMTGASDGREVADSALAAADQLAIDKNVARNADAAKWNLPGVRATVADVHQALADAHLENTTFATGAPKSLQAKAALDEIGKVIEDHTSMPGVGPGAGRIKFKSLNIEDADALKQAIGEIMFDKNKAPQGTPASVLSRKIYDAAKNAVSKVSPEYAGAMERSQENIRNLQSLRGEFGLKRNASSGAILGKLQTAMRNDVSSKFGYRGKLLDQLATKDPSLPYSLAGQDFSSWLPRGLARVGEGAAIGGAALSGHAAALLDPASLAVIAASIPRIQGEARYAAGTAVRGARSAGLTQKNLGRVSEILRLLGQTQDQNRGPAQ